MSNEFNECVNIKQKGKWHQYECKLGLWGIESTDSSKAYREALHYFNQYKNAGEYSSIIGGPSVFEVFKRNSSDGSL